MTLLRNIRPKGMSSAIAPKFSSVKSRGIHDGGRKNAEVSFVRLSLTNQTSGANMKPPKIDRKSTRLNSSHVAISYAVFCLKKKRIHKMNVVIITYIKTGGDPEGRLV